MNTRSPRWWTAASTAVAQATLAAPGWVRLRAGTLPGRTARPAKGLVACEFCDTLHRERDDEPGVEDARCVRCGGLLRRAPGTARELPLAFAAASLLLLAIAHSQPILTLTVQGRSQAASLWEAASVLNAQGATGLSALVVFTTLLAPVAEAAIALWILVPLRFGRRAPAVMPLLRLLQWVRPWVMVEVFMLGVLVATVKLSSLSTIIPGAGLWAFAAAMVTIAALGQTFDTKTLWSAAAKCRPR